MYNSYLTNFTSKRKGPGIKRLKHITKELEQMKFYRRGDAETKKKYLFRHKMTFLRQNVEYYSTDPQRISRAIVIIFIDILKKTVFRDDDSIVQVRILERYITELKLTLSSWLANNVPGEDKNFILEIVQNAPPESMFGKDHLALWQGQPISKFEILKEFRVFLYYMFFEWVLCEMDHLLPDNEEGEEEGPEKDDSSD